MIPTQCHLWTKEDLNWEDQHSLITVKNFLNEDHLIRALKKCPDCGQLYYYEKLEKTDWEKGEDPVYVTLIPIESDPKLIESLNQSDSLELLHYKPRLQFDWKKEQTVKWIK